MRTPGARESGPIGFTQLWENVLITWEIVAVPLVPEKATMSFETATDWAGPKPNANCCEADGGLVTWSWPRVPERQFSIGAPRQYASVAPVKPVDVKLPLKSSPMPVMTADGADTV